MQTLSALVLALACATAPAPDVVTAPPTPTELPLEPPTDLRAFVGQPVALRIRDLGLQVDGVEIQIRYLEAALIPAGDYVDLALPETFTVRVDALELRIPEQSLEKAMQGPGDGSPFRDLTVRTDGDAFVLEGHARALSLPFTFRAVPTVTERGNLALKLERLRVLGIGLRGFLDTFREPVERAVNKKGRRRLLNVEDDQLLIIDPFPFAGPPEVKAAFSSVEVHEGALVARLGEAPAPGTEPQGLTLTGGTIRTGGTLLFDATLSLVARDGGPLTLDPDRMDLQMSEGFTKVAGEKLTLYLVPLSELP